MMLAHTLPASNYVQDLSIAEEDRSMRTHHAALLVALTLSASAALAGTQGPGVITSVSIDSGGVSFFTVHAPFVNSPACNTLMRWAIPNTSAGQSSLSLVETAYATGKLVTVTGTGSCSTWGDSESFSSLTM